MADREQYEDLAKLMRHDFAANLRRQREQIGLTIDEIAAASYLTTSQIANIESGENDYSITDLLKYLTAAGLPLLME